MNTERGLPSVMLQLSRYQVPTVPGCMAETLEILAGPCAPGIGAKDKPGLPGLNTLVGAGAKPQEGTAGPELVLPALAVPELALPEFAAGAIACGGVGAGGAPAVLLADIEIVPVWGRSWPCP